MIRENIECESLQEVRHCHLKTGYRIFQLSEQFVLLTRNILNKGWIWKKLRSYCSAKIMKIFCTDWYSTLNTTDVVLLTGPYDEFNLMILLQFIFVVDWIWYVDGFTYFWFVNDGCVYLYRVTNDSHLSVRYDLLKVVYTVFMRF